MAEVRSKWRWCAAIAFGGVAVIYAIAGLPLVQLLERKVLDTHFLVRGTVPTNRIVLVVADDKSLSTFPELQVFWHPYYADAIRGAAAGGAKVAGLDVAFGIPVAKWAPENDRILAEAVSSSPIPVVCGFVPSLMEKQRNWPVPVNMIASYMGLSAFANLTVDSDDFVRNQELLERASDSSEQRPLARSFALRLAEKFAGADVETHNGVLTLAGRRIPLSPEGTLTINYAGPPGTFPRVPLSDFVAAYREKREDRLRHWVEGKIVLIGPDSFDDRHATPFYGLFSGPRWTTAGVEIHANTLETILLEKYLLPVPEWIRIGAMLAVAVITVLIGITWPAGSASAGLLATLTVVVVAIHALFRQGFILPTPDLLMVGLLCILATVVYRFSTAEKGRELFRHAVSVFVGKKVARTLESSGIALSGSRELVTILFTDIRGFTAFCEEKDPAVVVDLLNVYMRTMVSIVVRHYGNVNKFIGDGILAVFSDDDGCTPGDHPSRALRCAVAMVTAPALFETGAGLHTGLAVVGNVGSEDKMEHTVLGDTVNLASRLESLNKEHKTKVLMSGATRARIDQSIGTVHLGAVSVRGKAAPIELYTVASLVATPVTTTGVPA